MLRTAKFVWRLEQLRITSESPWLSLSLFSYSDTPYRKAKLAPLQERKMIDRFKLYAKGGDGGNGCYSVRRSRHDCRGRPDGGNGGRGGDVILECCPAVWDFSSLQHHVNAGKGGHGASKNKIGTRGAVKVVHVPVGTVVHLLKGEIPCIIEKSSSANPDPWELPGSLDMSSKSDNLHVVEEAESVNVAGQPHSYLRRMVEKTGRRELSTQGSKTNAHRSFSDSNRVRISTEMEIGEDEEDEEIGCNTQMETGEDEEIGYNMETETEEDEEIQYNVAELTEEGQQIIVARGGEGGLGNVLSTSFAKKPKLSKGKLHMNDAFDFEEDEASVHVGSPGSESVLVLELKSIADVGLVGMPNAGKSTLLGAISRAKPTVGHYAFTTLRPNLGNLNYNDFSITIADIPGLIKGAHKNRGLGHAFLRHIERTKVLAFVVDLAAALDGRKGIPPWEQLRDLILELEHHQEGLSSRPSLIVANKIDERGAEEVYEELKKRVQVVPIYPVCAVLEEGIPELKDGLRLLVNGGESYKLNINDIVLD